MTVAQLRTGWARGEAKQSSRQNRQRELKSSAAVVVGKGFQVSTVSFNNRTANRKPHTEAVRLGCVEGSEKLG